VGSQCLLVAWTTIKTIVPCYPKWIGLHHHLIQFDFQKSSSLIIVGFVDALMGFKGKNTCSKRKHKILMSYSITICKQLYHLQSFVQFSCS
jgi:hypothetical protein